MSLSQSMRRDCPSQSLSRTRHASAHHSLRAVYGVSLRVSAITVVKPYTACLCASRSLSRDRAVLIRPIHKLLLSPSQSLSRIRRVSVCHRLGAGDGVFLVVTVFEPHRACPVRHILWPYATVLELRTAPFEPHTACL